MFVAEFLKQEQKFRISKSPTFVPIIFGEVVLRNFTFVSKQRRKIFLHVGMRYIQ
jgi:hypothetical protein